LVRAETAVLCSKAHVFLSFEVLLDGIDDEHAGVKFGLGTEIVRVRFEVRDVGEKLGAGEFLVLDLREDDRHVRFPFATA
jgi:hypothetical protein